jgi:hypothetical protein
MHLDNVTPPYDTSRGVANAPVSREHQPNSNHVDMNMPLYSINIPTSSVPYQAGAFAHDVLIPVPADPHNMQQASYYSSNMPHIVSYAPSHDSQPPFVLSNILHVSIPKVNSEEKSPAQSSLMYTDPSYGTKLRRSISESTEGSGINFATDVDTLMKAIQAKQTNPPLENEQTVCRSPLRFEDQPC